MFKIRAVQAAFGDCFILVYGTENDPHYMLIDGGPPSNFTHLGPALASIKQAGQDLDLVVLSHVDKDHVCGLIEYFSALRSGDATLPNVDGLWHNSFANTIAHGTDFEARFQNIMSFQQADSMAEAGIAINGVKEGHKLRLDALALSIPINDGFPNDLITVDTATSSVTLANLTLTIVGPTQANLDELQDEWEQWLEDNEDAIGNGNFAALANSDQSIPNLSSIAFLVEADSKTALFTGDARSDHILSGLAQANALNANGELHVDLLKLMHHGSDRNVTKSFFRKVTANIYLVSADGTNDNPDIATLRWIVEVAAEKGFVPTLVLTNRTSSFDQLIQDHPPGPNSYLYQILNSANDWMTLDLA
jgi:beta-lactamase superfamily II metal-dependent hydrolase